MKPKAPNHAGFSRHSLFRRQGHLALLTVLLGLPGISQAQVPPITPSGGLNTQVNLSSNPPAGKIQYDITGGTRPGNGPNLFHSFGEFGVPTNNIANFLNETAIPTNNILGRVTGGNISNIFGTIQTTGFGNANLFLMNPAGFLFGPNATVNVGGMVAFTSADYLKLSDNARFNAIPNAAADALLTASPVASFGFLGSNPGAITVQGSQFSVTDGQSISLVGGNVTIQSCTPDGGTTQPARLSAPNGNILLASAASPGEFDAATLQPLPNVDGASFTSFGSIALASGSSIDVSGASTVSIRGGQFVLSVNDAVLTTSQTSGLPETISLSPGSSIVTSNSGADPGADVQLIASNVEMDGASMLSATMGDGPGGNVTIQGRTGAVSGADSVTLSNGSSISAFGFGAGQAGDIAVVTPALTMRDASFIATGSFGDGNAGNIMLNVGALDLANASIQSIAFAGGRGGDIGITSNGFTTNSYAISDGGFVSTDAFGSGSAGNITLNAGSLTLNTGEIRTTTGDAGSAGNISITTSGEVSLLTGSNLSRISNGSTGVGPTGDVTLHVGSLNISPNSTIEIQTGNGDTTGTLHIDSSGPITVSGVFANRGLGPTLATTGPIEITAPTMTLNNGTIETQISGDGRAGDILLQVGNLHINGASRIDTTTVGPGRGGDINITSDFVSLSGAGSGLFSGTAPGTSGHGGDIHVRAQQVEITDGAVISAKSSGSGAAGSAIIEGTQSSAQSVLIDGVDSGIFTTTEGTGAGGSITIESNQVQLANNATISAKTTGSGNAGSILVKADSVSIESGSLLTNSSVKGDSGEIPTGNAGNITIQGLAGPAQSVLITGFDENFNLVGGIFTDTQGTGAGGTINISAHEVQLTDGATLSAQTSGSGRAGDIAIHASQVTVDTSLITAETTGDGNAGTILLRTTGNLSVNGSAISGLAIPGKGFTGGQAGTIQLLADQDISLTNSELTVQTGGNKSGGEILFNGNNLRVESTSLKSLSQPTNGLEGGDAGSIVAEIAGTTHFLGSDLLSTTSGNGNAGSISLKTGTLSLENSRLSTTTKPGPLYKGGAAGNILLDVDQLTVTGDSLISSFSTHSVGRAGNVTVIARESMELLGSGNFENTILTNSEIGAFPSCPGTCGDAGTISISSPIVTLDRAGLSSRTEGNGQAGNINLTVGNLTLQNGSQISAEARTSRSTGAGGDISITATGSVLVSDPGQVIGHPRPSGIFTNTEGSGAGGNMTLSSQSLTVQNGGTLSAATSGAGAGGTITADASQVTLNNEAVITASTTGAGAGGSIGITADSTFVSSASAVRTTASQASGGNIDIVAGQSVTLNNGSLISALSTGAGDAGNILINAGQNYTSTDSVVTTEATAPGTEASGGNITVLATDMVQLTNHSQLNASVQGSAATVGGNITIDPQYVILLNSQILAKATQGQGGAILINITNGGLFLPDVNSTVSASSQFGVNGTVTIQSPNAPASGKIQPLGKTPLQATSLLNQRCASLAGGEFSSFTVAGRDSLPTEPSSWLASPLATLNAGMGLGAKAEGVSPVARGEGLEGETALLSLRQIAPAGFLTQAFAVNWSAGCSS